MADSLPIQPISKQRRTPAPILSPQHLALARSLPHSSTSTPSPSLLTPPVHGTSNMSPPPRHEADDYMNVHGFDHDHHERKYPRRKTRKLYYTRQGSEESRPPPPSLKAGPQTASSNGSGCEICAAGISNDDDDKSPNTPLTKSFGRSNLRTHLHEPHKATEFKEGHIQTSPALNPSITVVDEPDSPAVSSLRSLSFQIPTRSNSQGLQRVSTSLSNTFNLFRHNPRVSFADVPPHKASKKGEEALRKSSAHSKSLAYRDIVRRRPSFTDCEGISHSLETPATITLRKASNVYAASPSTTSMSASLVCERDYTRPSDASASELLAFYSSPTLDKVPTLTDLPTAESPEAPGSLKEPPTITFALEPQSSRRRSKSVSQSTNISNARRCSTPAEAALTFSDVHIAPGSFAIGPQSSKQPLIPTESKRRISTVQFRSRNSIHEVIWREDETMSDSSFTASSGTSQYTGHSFRSTPTPDSDESPIRGPAIEPNETQPLLVEVPESMSFFPKMPDNLFRWTWGMSSASVEDTSSTTNPWSDTHAHVAEATTATTDANGDPVGHVLVTSTSDPGFASLQLPSDQQDSRSQKPSLSNLPSVESFPPLRPRSSTAEWLKAPLVDLNDPLAGRVAQYPVQTTTHPPELGTGAVNVTADGERRYSLLKDTVARRWSSIPHAYARLGLIGSVGSLRGASSRRRILSRREF